MSVDVKGIIQQKEDRKQEEKDLKTGWESSDRRTEPWKSPEIETRM